MTTEFGVRPNPVPPELVKYTLVNRLLLYADPQRVAEWINLYRESLTKDQFLFRRLELLEQIMMARESRELKFDDMKIGYFRDWLNYPVVYAFLKMLIYKSKLYTFQIGVLASLLSSQWPVEIESGLKSAYSEGNVTATANSEREWLCDDSEEFLLNSIEKGALVLVNNCLLFKFVGYLTALCVRTTKFSGGGVVIRGNWYSPQDYKLTAEILNAFFTQQKRFDSTNSTWQIMRAASQPAAAPMDLSQFMEEVDAFVEHIPKISV